MAEEFSPFDLRILEQIQKDAAQSSTELAEKVGLSQSPCWRRLQRLKDEGYIARQVAILDRSKFGETLSIFATLRMATLSDSEREEFERKIWATEEIVECHTVLGESDALIKVIAPSLAWYQKFIFKVLLKLPGVRDVQSTVTLSEVKYTTAIPVRGARAL